MPIIPSQATPAQLELPPARERLLRNIVAAGDAGFKIDRVRKGPNSPMKTPFDASRLVICKYVSMMIKTEEVTDATGTYDVHHDTWTDPGGTMPHNLFVATELGRQVIEARDAYLTEKAALQTVADTNRQRRLPGGETVVKFDSDGQFTLRLYPDPLISLGKDFMLAIELGLVDQMPTIINNGKALRWELTATGAARRRLALGLPALGAGDVGPDVGDDEPISVAAKGRAAIRRATKVGP